jgi:hypothetical protein
MSKKLLQYYQGKMQTGGKVLPLYAEGDPIPSRYAPIPRAASDMRVQMPVIARTAAEARAARAFNNGTIRPAKSQNRFAKALAIAANPATAASYAVKGQPIPDNFDRAETNRYDIATSVANPFSYLKQVVDTKRELEEGNYGSAALNAMGILPTRLPNFGRITSANLDGFLGKQLNNVNRKMEHLRGKNNEGVFMMRDRDDIVIKLEDANRTAHFTDTPEFAHTNMAEKMRDIPDNLPISKTLYQLDDLRLKNYQAPMRASFMKRVTGVPGGQLAPSQFVKIPDKSYQELYSNLKTLRNNDLAFDYFGNNYLYNPNTQQFGLFDIGLQPKNRGYWADDVYGASSKELFGLDTSGKNIKEAIREKMSGDFRYTMEPEYDAFYDGASKLSIADLQAITAEGSRRISQRVKDALANMNYYAEGGPIDPPYPIRGQVIPRATTDNTRVAPPDVVFYTDQGYQYAQSQYKKAKEFHEKWMNSPMYNRMIQKSDPTQAEDITKRRKKNMEGVKFKFVSVQPKNNPNTGGFSDSVTGDVTILPRGLDVHGMGTHELSHSIDRPSKGTIMLQGLKNLIFNDDDETVIDTWNKSRLMPTNDINTISKMAGRNQSIYTKQNTSKEDKEWFEYVTNPTETRARLNDIRQSAYESGLYDPFKEAVTPAIYNELRDHRYEKGKNRGFDAMRQLRGVYTDQQILNLLNSVSKTNKPPTEVENYMMSIGGPVDPPVKDNTSARIKVIPTAEQLKYNRMQNQIARMPKKEAFVQSPGISPEGYGRRMYDKAEAEKRMNRILYAADAATDVMQVGNFIPFPAAQFIGKVGNMLGSGVDAFQAGVEARKGNVGSSAINYASGILPSVIKDPAVLGGYRRSAKYSFGNRSFYNPVDKRYGRMTSKQLMGNRALLGALGAETVYDAYQDGGLLTRTISCSNCGHSWKAVDGGIDPMNCHKCGGLVKMAKGGMTDGPKPKKKTLILAEHDPGKTYIDENFKDQVNPFITEAASIKKYVNKYFPGEDVEIVPTYKDNFKEALKRSDANTRLVTLAHAGKNLFGVPVSEYLQSVSKTPYQNCYAGTCYGDDIVEGKYADTGIDINNLNNFNVRSGHLPWSGFAAVNRGGEEGFKDSFFRRSKNPEINKLISERRKLTELLYSDNGNISDEEYQRKTDSLDKKLFAAYKKHTINQEKAIDVKTYNFVPYPARVNKNELPVWGSSQIFQNGGETDGPGPRPVYVSSPNDPRLKKYADSLNAYNAGEDAYKFGKNIYNLVRIPKNNEFRNNYNIRRVSTKERSPFMDTNIYPVESYSETYDRKPGSFWEQNVKDNRPNYYIGNNGEHWEPTGTGWSRFKKPVQPVEYRPQADQFGLTREDYKKAFGSGRKGFISTPGNKLGDGYYKYKKGNETYKIYSRSGGLNWVEKEKPTAKAKPVVAQPQIVRAQQPVAPFQPVQPTPPAYRMQGTTPVYGPSNSLIGMMNQQSGEFYPDYMNTAARARVNQEDTDMIGNQEKILQYLRAYGMSNPKVIPQKKDGGQMIKRADGSYSRRGLWDNVRANTGSGKKPTAQMLEQERKIKAKNK